ncbi:MAG: aminomethyltransferase beta-barrel domain-containing protein, partial [Phycisphaerae bacterium]
ITDRFRQTTLGVLRVAFLSALVLEMVASISTAIVAVQIGLRLLAGRLAFVDALFVLLLAPEFYMALRNLGLRFHAGMSGVSAAQRIFEVLETPGHTRSHIVFHDHARRLGLARIATGHYARTVETPAGRRIARAIDPRKDQSYALFCVRPTVVADMLLPLGELPGKEDTRRLARGWHLPVHAKPESQEICFVPEDDYTRLLAEAAPHALRPGEIVSEEGEPLGTHDGYGRYTIGQRRGLGVAGGVPLYVTRIDAPANRVVLGTREQVASASLKTADVTWHAETARQFEATVQIRYNHRGSRATVTRTAEGFEAEFAQPQHAITPGQAAVVYDGDLLLGGGWIT